MASSVIQTDLGDVLILQPDVFPDSRGLFFESFNTRDFENKTGLKRSFVQDNQSCSAQHVLRGLHYQVEQQQGKLVRVTSGEVFDVAVDIRKGSSSFGKWIGVVLSAENRRQLWIPEGFAHGFLVLSESADFLYKTTDYYAPNYERCIVWNDPSIGIEWPIGRDPILSESDKRGSLLANAEALVVE